ncbi:hydrogenase formation protein HypD [Pontiella sulfatireligans]|uniref:Hydrogenase expression/formation protein HypD n=1 Tax=Pontiella sulfatireligans TaxID=2750658 RepID=A0A6C2UMB6_9BACT|nr:hydrogenase formation protein HypD [Pontiella sulfatireligans]VGO20567.1 Hydrogenase expression/formation protein HypD [Pontiella sulfatireligans]
MNLLKDFKNPVLARKLSAAIAETVGDRPFSIMEVCGGQTHTIYKYRLREMLPPNLRLVSGPGCPVCVTPIEYIDKAVFLALEKGASIYTFGDLVRVPGTMMSLEKAQAEGADVQPVYSPFQSLQAAKANPERHVVFLGIGFETTLPGVGLVIREAQRSGVENFSVLLSAKRVPPVLDALLSSGKAEIDGFITPGHVTSIIGTKAYDALCETYRVPMVVGGFEPLDLLGAVHLLAGELAGGGTRNLNAYSRASSKEGNVKAQQVMEEVFEEKDDELRGLGVIPKAGYGIRESFAEFDADRRFDIVTNSREPKGCICGEILCGIKAPEDCPLFGAICTPDAPVGSCMVSNEGACNAAYLFRD